MTTDRTYITMYLYLTIRVISLVKISPFEKDETKKIGTNPSTNTKQLAIDRKMVFPQAGE